MKQFQLPLRFALCAALFTFMFNELQAQKIVRFSQYKIYKNDYGSTKIKIQPHTRSTNVGEDESKYQRSFNVYGVLICYTLDGKRKALRQDMTYKLKNNDYYEVTLAYSAKSDVSSVNVTYFNMVDDPKTSWPKKDDCF
ncbi:hypothetical protein MED152_16391 [Polaribacter sp. MED152]|nr:hypothetical protein MED152_16391 [Polaribacter sp. MED152]